jgi:vitamin B12 transporter
MMPALSRFAIVPCAAVLFVAPSTLAAQAAGDTARLPRVVVTATRVPVAQRAATAATTVITGDELRARGITTLTDALRAVPGAVVTPSGGPGANTSLFLRGGESDYVRVLIDGVPVNDPGGVFDFSTLTTDNIDRIEIVRGPSSVLYGSDAMTGVVQVFTRRGGSGTRASGSVRGGTHRTLDGELAVEGGAGAAAYSLGIARHSTDGILAFNNEYYSTVASAQARLAAGERSDARITARYSDGTYHYPTNSFGALSDSNAFRENERLTVGVEVGHRFTSRVEARLALNSSQVEAGTTDRSDSPGDTLGSYGFVSSSDVYRRGVDARLNLRLGEATVLTVGGDHERQREASAFESLSEFGPFADSFRGRRRNSAGYLQLLGSAGARAAYSLGLRYDDNERFGSFSTYRAAAGFALAGGTSVRAAIGSAFKEPSFFEGFAGSGTQENPDLRPEQSRSWEAGIEQQLVANLVRLSATYFDQRFDDLIQFTPLPPGSGFFGTYRNLPAARARGVELETRLTLAGGFAAGASYTWLRSRVTNAGAGSPSDSTFVEARRLLRRPTHLAALDLSYAHGARGRVGLALNVVGHRDDLDFSQFPAPKVVLPSYTKVDLSGELWLVRDGTRFVPLGITLRVENLFDDEYQVVHNFDSPGRTILVGIRAATSP